jgi:diguanylate cyclase (GGDEF)-like protein
MPSGTGTATPPRLSGRIAGTLFLTGAAITVACLLLPHPASLDEVGFWIVFGVQFVLGFLLLGASRFNSAPQRFLPAITIVGAILAVTAAVYFNGERTGGPALLNEFFYVWPALFAGYFYKRFVVVAVVVAISVSYLAVCMLIGVALDTLLIRALITISIVAGTALVAHSLRNYVDALISRLDALARTDALTGLLNRRSFDECLATELARVKRVPQPLAVLIGDLDHFKATNDQFGHAAGDGVLVSVGAQLQASVRRPDTLARIGGEEFAVVMPNTTAEGGVELAERLRQAIGRVTDPAGRPIRITFGVASTEDCGQIDSDSLVLAADRALYSGKADGRDQTQVHRSTARAAITGVGEPARSR